MKWNSQDENRLRGLISAGKSTDEIAQLLNRTREAIVLKAKRLGLRIPEKHSVRSGAPKDVNSEATTTTRLQPITPADALVSVEDMMKTLLGALQALTKPDLSQLEIKRFRSIASGARIYMAMLQRYQAWTRLEQQLVNSQAHLLEVFKMNASRTTDPVEKARWESHIKEIEDYLQDNAKTYRPFEKKPSLVTPAPV